MSKQPYNTMVSVDVVAILKRPQDYGFKTGSDFLCAAVLAYAHSYQNPGGFDGMIVRAVAREEAEKAVAKLAKELRAYVDILVANPLVIYTPELKKPASQEHVNIQVETPQDVPPVRHRCFAHLDQRWDLCPECNATDKGEPA